MPIGDQAQFGLAMRFTVTIDQSRWDLGSWQKAEGLDVAWEPVEYRAGDAGNDRWYVQGIAKFKNVVLSRAVNKDDFNKVKDWLKDGSSSGSGHTGCVTLLDQESLPVATWNLNNVMPLHWSVSGFDASQSKLAIETLELAHMGFLDD